MNARATTFGSPSAEPSTTRPYATTNVRKTLHTTQRFSSDLANHADGARKEYLRPEVASRVRRD